MEELKGGNKTNGSSTDVYGRGSFVYKEYGKARLYVFWEVTPYLAIQTKEKTYFYSGKTRKETLETKEKLEENWQQYQWKE